MKKKFKYKAVNKKVRNASPNIFDKIAFKSKLETFVYKLFKEAGIRLRYEEKTYVLVPVFEYQGKKFRQMTITPDFSTADSKFVIEAKGFPNDVFPVKWKLLNYQLSQADNKPILFLVSNQKEARDALIHVLSIYDAHSFKK